MTIPTPPSTNALLEQLAVLIPLKAEAGSWEFGLAEAASAAWSAEFPEVQVIWGDDGSEPGQPFNYSRAMNVARSMTERKLLLNSEANHLPPDRWSTINAIRLLLRQDLPWVRPFRNRRTLSEVTTRRYLEDPTVVLVPDGQVGGMAINLVRAEVWDDFGGYDERFAGWGFENGAYRRALRTLHPGGRRANISDGPFILWTPEVEREAGTPLHLQDTELFQRYIDASGGSHRHIHRMRKLVTEANESRRNPHVPHVEPEPVATTPSTAGIQLDAAGASPDPASTAAAADLSLSAIVPDEDQGTMAGIVTKIKAPAAVEGYRWPTEEPALQDPEESADDPEGPTNEQPEGTHD